ncbi:hypothetical protein [Plantactinospora sonchi]|uniref:SdpI family protein n=1 Tax=Plantactinospora sonchi TaxID=1544735 RepID=A0ABU7RR70_9ACTN
MYRDFYTTLAQVLPVLLLALLWDSRYLDQLRRQARPSRRVDPAHGYFWTKPRVRAYSLTIASVIVTELAVVVFVLAGALSDSAALRAVLVAGLVLALATLLTRVAVDVFDATRPDPPAGAPATGAPTPAAPSTSAAPAARGAPDEAVGTCTVTDDGTPGRPG